MKKILPAAILVILVFVSLSLGNAALQKARQESAAYNALAASSAANAVLVTQLSKQQAQIAQLQAQNESALYSNARRDNRTVNAIARWHMFAPTLRYALLAVLVLLVDGIAVVFFAWRDQRRKSAMTINETEELF